MMDNKNINTILVDGNRYSLFISELLESKIRFLCNKFNSTEWSGVLFYKIKGNLAEEDCKLIAKDFILMDIGSSVFTSFKLDPVITNYMVKNDLLDYNIGLIHSHHQMDTFFSPTDINTLVSEAKETNHFLSLIVNNIGKYNGYITKKVTYVDNIKRKSNYNSFENVNLQENYSIAKTYQAIEKCKLDINIPVNTIKIDEKALLDRIKEIENKNNYSITYNLPQFMPHKMQINYKFNIEYVRYLANQILCCSVLPIRNANKFKLKIENLLDIRFKSLTDYESYISTLIDFLFTEAIDRQDGIDVTYYLMSLSNEIINVLKKEKFQHKYIDTIIKILEEYKWN